MRVILFSIGNFHLRSYGLIVALAIILAIGVAYFLTKKTKYQEHLMDMSLYLIVSAIIGARIWHVFIFQWPYYSENLGEIFTFWNGGISIQGALVGGLIGAIYYTKKKNLDFFEMADYLAPAIILGQAVGRIACFLNGDAFGSPTNSGFGVVYPEGTMAYEQYGSQPLWPAEVFEGQLNLIIFALLLIMRNTKWPKGFIFFSYAVLYFLARFFLEFLRGDSPRYLLDWTGGQWTSVAVIAIALVIQSYLLLKNRSKSNAS